MYKVNLLPREMITERAGGRGPAAAPLVSLVWRIAVGVVVFGYAVFLITLFLAKHTLAEKQAALEALAPQVAAAEALRQERERAEAMLTAWRGVLLDREDWVFLLREINAVLPADTWLTAVKTQAAAGEEPDDRLPFRPDGVRIEGAARSLTAVGVLVHKLQEMPHFASVALEEVVAGPDGALSFKISLELARSGAYVAAAE